MNKCIVYDICNHKDCEAEHCLRKSKLESLYNNSLLSKWQQYRTDIKLDADGTDRGEFVTLSNIEQNIRQFVQEGKNLYIHSHNVGCGKTTWAIRLIQAYFNKIWPRAAEGKSYALFISVPRFLAALKDNITVKNDYIAFIKEHVQQAELVVWDDIAAKNGSNFDMDNLLSIIDARIALGKSNIYTSNLGPAEMSTALGSRLASRICNYSKDIELNGADKRCIVSQDVGGDN